MTETVKKVADFMPHRGPWCSFPIDVERCSGPQWSERERLAKHKGIDPVLCGYPAEVLVDGQPRCRRHAGEELLRRRIGPPARRGRPR